MLNHRKLNWTQLTILSLLWNKTMYGLEIKNNLEARQIPVTLSQLYPMLKKLHLKGFLESHKEDRDDTADRIFYRTTQRGQEVIQNYLKDFISIFFEGYTNIVGFIGDEVHKVVNLTTPGIIIADLSYDVIESVLVKLVPIHDPIARYFIISETEIKKDIVKYRVQYHKLDEIVRIYTFDQGKSILPDASVDVVLLLFTMHELGTDYYISEAKRILKPDGSIVIADNLIETGKKNFLLDALIQIFPARIDEKFYFENLIKLLEENNLKIVQEIEVESFRIILIQHK